MNLIRIIPFSLSLLIHLIPQSFFFFFNDTATPEIYPLSLPAAFPIHDERREPIARHRRDRAERVPGMATLEEPLDLAAMLARHSTPQRLLVVDCLTLWLTNWMMPAQPSEELARG